ncbi:flagellar motor protein MotB [Clostridium aminobutyricum]|uniref:OmpA family protein n=1 Tax=Clostridium aminobutyricum TaxID=33953 RepID=A0A939IK03_CLOAM|nr:flagellar motor protein MotB [Clostridium aminobutyricum]MBN7774133.1 OmpA family protein [Clostridium aminobutyricum]
MARKKYIEKDNSDRWLLTYSDLITLLMVFFVVMYAMSAVDQKKYEQLAQSLSATFDSGSSLKGGGDVQTTSGGSILPTSSALDVQAKDLSDVVDPELLQVAKQIQEMLKEKGLEGQVGVSIRERGVVISLLNTVLFDSGSADVKQEGLSTLIEIGNIAKTVDHYIRVEGNTDDVPMNSPKFPSNWELSVVRATEVVKLLIDRSEISPDKISAIGYGEYRPTLPNISQENRAKNRRVDIVILSNNFNSSESESVSVSGSDTKSSTEH